MALLKLAVVLGIVCLKLPAALAQTPVTTQTGFLNPADTADPATIVSSRLPQATEWPDPCTANIPCKQGEIGCLKYFLYDYSCGFYTTVDNAIFRAAVPELRGFRWDEEWRIPPERECTRICTNNELGTHGPLSALGSQIGYMADRPLGLCCNELYGGKSGTVHHYSEGFRVVLGAANCADGPGYPPSYDLSNLTAPCLA